VIPLFSLGRAHGSLAAAATAVRVAPEVSGASRLSALAVCSDPTGSRP